MGKRIRVGINAYLWSTFIQPKNRFICLLTDNVLRTFLLALLPQFFISYMKYTVIYFYKTMFLISKDQDGTRLHKTYSPESKNTDLNSLPEPNLAIVLITYQKYVVTVGVWTRDLIIRVAL